MELTATASDGTPIRAVLHGRGERRIALVHSLAMTAEFWEPVIAALGCDWSVLAIDCRGHGASGKPQGPYRVEVMADDLAAAMDAARWSDAIVGGASMGGCIALSFASRHPDRTRALALIDTTAWYGEDAEEVWEQRGRKAVGEGLGALTGFQRTRWFSDAWREANPEAVKAAVKVFNANDPAAYLEACRMLGRMDLRTALLGLMMPVLILVGEEDHATPPDMARAMADAIQGAEIHILEGLRHLTPLEAPDVVAGHLDTVAERAW